MKLEKDLSVFSRQFGIWSVFQLFFYGNFLLTQREAGHWYRHVLSSRLDSY